MSKEPIIGPIIGENTKVTIWFVVTIIGGMWWLSQMYADIQAQAAEIRNLKNEAAVNQSYLIEEIRRIRIRLDDIADHLKR